MIFSPGDIEQIKEKGLTVSQVNSQLETFKNGLPPVRIASPATIEKGILRLSDEDLKHYSSCFEQEKARTRIGKFVPASGQATRMFKFLFEFLECFNPEEDKSSDFLGKPEFKLLNFFNDNKHRLPFYNRLQEGIKSSNPKYNDELYALIKFMLDEKGLHLGGLPKGLIDFHIYGDKARTAFEEHLHEALSYLKCDNKIKLHFTVSPDHRPLFKSKLAEIRRAFEKENRCKLEVSFSVQDPSTDTLAVNPDNSPFRDENGNLVFRPSGHGALLLNLDALEEDLVFLRNIDNVATEKRNAEISIYRSALAGLLIEKKNIAFELLAQLNDADPDTEKLNSLCQIAKDELNIFESENMESVSKPDRIKWLRSELERPIRVCGMVKNEGQPGGGPFWVAERDGSVSLQIVELAQIDRDQPDQAGILSKATHFNPVDIVCWLTNSEGQPYNLLKFSDPDSAFISEKTHMGKPLKAMEMPGLWNGGMANWMTFFVEVPLSSFNPVKTVNDLLGPMHSNL